MTNLKSDIRQILGIYVLISLTGFAAWYFSPWESKVATYIISHLAMTLVCFAFSLFKKNSSVYDAFWSYVPFLFCLFLVWDAQGQLTLFQWISLGVVSLWSWRLTLNWLRSWHGFQHEDWRYIDLANKSGAWYPLVNFSAIHLFPTLIVFAAFHPVFFVFEAQNAQIGLFIVGSLVSLLAFLLNILPIMNWLALENAAIRNWAKF